MRDLAPIAILAVAFVLVYVELAVSLAAAYALYVAILVLRGRVDWRALVRLWGAVVVGALVVLNSYLFRELHYVASQASNATAGVKLQGASLFGYVLIPAELPAIVGLKPQDTQPSAHFLDIAIAISIVLLAVAAVATLLTLRHGIAASCVLTTYLALGVFLGLRSSDFGLFKLFMYVQPFLAAGIAVWLSRINSRVVFGAVAVLLILLVGAQVHTGMRYVKGSRNPIDLPHASASDLLPVFRRWFAASRAPVISVTENPALAKLETASIGNRPLYFISKYLFPNFASVQEAGWKSQSFATRTGNQKRDSFLINPAADSLLARGDCLVVLPAGSQTIVNRLSFPEGPQQLAERRCGAQGSRTLQNLLVFTSSTLGQAFYTKFRSRVSFWQLESDYFYPGHTFSGFGRFALFRVFDPTATVRLELWVTTTVRQDGSNRIPPADIVGAEKKGLPIVGRGSARVFSPPLVPQMIGGQPYVLLDMGTPGRLAVYHRSALQGIYGRSIPFDPRYLTSYVRDISLISGKQYERLRAPAVLSHFPADLANPDLEYSGLYEDGWVAEDFYATLAGGRAGDLVVRANVLPQKGQHLEVLVNGYVVVSRRRPARTARTPGTGRSNRFPPANRAPLGENPATRRGRPAKGSRAPPVRRCRSRNRVRIGFSQIAPTPHSP